MHFGGKILNFEFYLCKKYDILQLCLVLQKLAGAKFWAFYNYEGCYFLRVVAKKMKEFIKNKITKKEKSQKQKS